MDKTILKFEFTIEQTNLMMAALGRMPYESVAPMIAEIQKQAQAQLPAQDETVTRKLPDRE